jgi:hypothetical protein
MILVRVFREISCSFVDRSVTNRSHHVSQVS